MSNPLYQDLKGGQQGQPVNFVQFMRQMRGQDPNQLLQQLVSSGQINQDQLNQAQQAYQQMSGRFDGFKSMFGF